MRASMHYRPVAVWPCRGLLIWRKRRVPQFFEVGGWVGGLLQFLLLLPSWPACCVCLLQFAAPHVTLVSHPPPTQWPRPELWLLWCLLPIMAAQGASELCMRDGAWLGRWAALWNHLSCCRSCSAEAACSILLKPDAHPNPPIHRAEFLTSSGGAVVAGLFFGLLIPLAFVAASFYLTLHYVSSGASAHQVEGWESGCSAVHCSAPALIMLQTC